MSKDTKRAKSFHICAAQSSLLNQDCPAIILVSLDFLLLLAGGHTPHLKKAFTHAEIYSENK